MAPIQVVDLGQKIFLVEGVTGSSKARALNQVSIEINRIFISIHHHHHYRHDHHHNNDHPVINQDGSALWQVSGNNSETWKVTDHNKQSLFVKTHFKITFCEDTFRNRSIR